VGSLQEKRVFETIKNFVTDLANGGRQTGAFGADDYRIAVAALLLHAATIDGQVAGPERDKLRALLEQRFALDAATAHRLIEQATTAEREAIDLYHFTRELNQSLDEVGRLRMIEMMWEIAYADGAASGFEENLIWRAADLLGVSSHERIALRQRVAAARGSGA
jgi:uncharacterized tellurite resistance protein B-like protein